MITTLYFLDEILYYVLKEDTLAKVVDNKKSAKRRFIVAK